MTESKRKTGYYHVSIDGKIWRVAHWIQYQKKWYITGSELTWDDDEFKTIDETAITRDINNNQKEKV